MTTKRGDKVYATREEYEAWAEAIGAECSMGPDYRRSDVEFKVRITPTVHIWIKGRAILCNESGEWYFGSADETSEGDGWNEVRFSTWIWENVTCHGKGSQSDAVRAEVKEIFSYLTNDINDR